MSFHLALFIIVSLLCPQERAQNQRYEEGMAHLKQAGVYAQDHRDKEALEELQKAYELLPPSYNLAMMLGEAYLQSGDPKAVEVLQKAVAMRSTVESHILLGQAWWGRSEFQKGLDEFQRAVRLDPKSAEAQLRTGYAYYLLGNTILAKRYLTAALKLDPDLPLANLSMGHLLAGEGAWEEAIPLLEKYAGLRPNDFEVRLKLGQIYLDHRQYDKALVQLQQAERLAPQEKRIQYVLGKLYSAEGKTDLAKQAFAKFSELEAAEQERSRLKGEPYIQRTK